jgi:Fe-only nitrogenase accessory protein AnfO
VLIACHVGKDGEVVDFFEPGSLRLFEDVSGTWVCVREVALELGEDMSLSVLKEVLRRAVDGLGDDARVFLARELRGVLRVFLEEFGLRVWKSRGSLDEQLSDAARQEREVVALQKAADARIPRPDPVGDPAEAIYRIDLVALLSEGSCHVSRDVLMPFLETTAFSRLEVVCDHVPRWFPAELPELGLRATVPEAAPGSVLTVTVEPVGAPLSSPPGRRPGHSGCSCGG